MDDYKKAVFPKPKQYFQKKEFQISDFESFIFWSKFRFLGDCFRAFCQIFLRQATMVGCIFI